MRRERLAKMQQTMKWISEGTQRQDWNDVAELAQSLENQARELRIAAIERQRERIKGFADALTAK